MTAVARGEVYLVPRTLHNCPLVSVTTEDWVVSFLPTGGSLEEGWSSISPREDGLGKYMRPETKSFV